MNALLFQFGLTAFVTLLVTVDPLGLLPVFAALTVDMTLAQRRVVMRRAILTAT